VVLVLMFSRDASTIAGATLLWMWPDTCMGKSPNYAGCRRGKSGVVTHTFLCQGHKKVGIGERLSAVWELGTKMPHGDNRRVTQKLTTCN
jgi:hypothetical protein